MKSPRDRSEIMRRVRPPDVCLTFDDGPDPCFTGRVLDVLAAARVKASFFVVGEAVQRYPQLVARMAREGHSIGNHSFSHRHPWGQGEVQARIEVRRTSEAIAAVTGSEPRWFRPPHGRLTRPMLEQASSASMRTVLWSRSAVDWGPLGTGRRVASRLQTIRAGDIVLMHDAPRHRNHPEVTLALLPGLIEHLHRQGLVVRTLDAVLADYDPDQSGYPELCRPR
jgi:peptidoglycan-N-acetylglucosamine deacetylase